MGCGRREGPTSGERASLCACARTAHPAVAVGFRPTTRKTHLYTTWASQWLQKQSSHSGSGRAGP